MSRTRRVLRSITAKIVSVASGAAMTAADRASSEKRQISKISAARKRQERVKDKTVIWI
jgi:hypothetical protein